MDYHKIFRHIPQAMVVVSPNYIILAATDEYLRLTKRTIEQISGKHFLLEAFPDRVLTYEENPVRKSLDKTLQSKKIDFLDVIRYDLPNPDAGDGEYDVRYWEASHTPVLNAEGRVEYIIQQTSDVTERELAKLALSESEEKFRFMAEAMPQLIFTTDATGELTYLNKRWEIYTSFPLHELLQEGWQKVIHPDDLPAVSAKWEEAFHNKANIQIELRKRDKHGVFRWHLCRTQPMEDEEGNIIMWVGSSTDIHDTRVMVQELLETNEQMSLLSDQVQHAYEKAESERKMLETLLVQAPAMFCILKGPEHRFELINERYQQLYPNKEMLHKPLAEAVPEIVEQGFIELLDEVYNTGKAYVAEEVPIMLDKNNTGELEETYFTFSYHPIFESDKVSGILAFGYEVTEQVKYRKKLRELGRV
ncbi:PAS domain-containing protein [Pontibacter toksunensis]|uniref:histidine kinase n=1 Tax=Pontibacter toksunensis TaxID=1332631 RepID=A0ABW6C0E5_9BACT